jgi:hypothetical protein
MRRAARAVCRASVLVLAAGLLAGPSTPPRAPPAAALEPAPPAVTAPALPSNPPPPVPAPLTPGGRGLRAGPVPVPLELQLPTLGTTAEVLSVGITANDVMDAPMGPASDPVWQQAFLYRGSAMPGSPSTALLAGHISDPLGRPGIFAFIDRLRPGDPILVHDTRTGLEIRFSVTHSESYSLEQAADPAVLRRIYGDGPVAGTRAQPSADGLAHVTLITCAGTFRGGTHDHRLVVSATRIL